MTYQYDSRVVAVSSWIDVRYYTFFLEPKSGIYLFADDNYNVKYIGKAGIGRMIAEVQNTISRGKITGATHVKALYTNSDVEAWSLEKDLIKKYNLLNNKT